MTADDGRRIDDPPRHGRDPSGEDPTKAEEPTLAALRLRIQALAASEGRFVAACARTGESPVPVDGYRFDSRAAAAEAARYVVEYRARLRELDLRTPWYDPVVHELPDDADAFDAPSVSLQTLECVADRDWRRPLRDHAGSGADRVDGAN